MYETTHEGKVAHFELKHIFAISTSVALHNILPFMLSLPLKDNKWLHKDGAD